MKPRTLLLALLALSAAPALATYNERTGVITNERWKSGVPLGGIGVGKIEVFTDGSFGRATINHSWDRPTGILRDAVASIVVQMPGTGATVTRALRSAPDGGERGGLRNVAGVTCRAMFPSAELAFHDPALRASVALHAWSSLIPNNVKDSSLPVAHLDYTVRNTSRAVQNVVLSLRWPNILGFGGRAGREEWTSYAGNTMRPAVAGTLHGVLYTTSQNYSTQRQNVVGQYFVGVDEPAEAVHVASAAFRGEAPADASRPPTAAVSAVARLKPGQAHTFHFLIAWAMPTHRVARKVITGYTTAAPNDEGIAALVDNNPATRWSTNRDMRPNDAIEITLPKNVPLGTLTLDSAASPNDFPHGYRIQLRVGRPMLIVKEATEETAKAEQRDGVLTIDLNGQMARCIRITNMNPSDQWFWSIHELRLTGADGNTIPLAPSQIHAYSSEATYQERGTSNVGAYWQNFFTGARDIAAYAARNAPRLWRQTAEWQNLVASSNLPGWFQRQMVNAAFPAYSNTVLTRDGRFSVLESPVDMAGALGTMDQRMAAHALWIQFFSRQDRKELDMYAHAQDLTPEHDGRITHFVGNVHESVGDPNVGYGVTDWPDLSSAWVMQTLKEYRWTGDRAFLVRNISHIEHAMAFIKAQDKFHDGVAQGGSTYDYEHMPPGAFIYSASCTMGALRAAAAAERALGRTAQARAYDARLKVVRAGTMRLLWNGYGFRKWAQSTTGQTVENSFVAALAGDWLAQLTGLNRTLPNATVNTTIKDLLVRHLWAFAPVPPMEVTQQGKLFTSTCFVIQHQTYLGDEAIYQGYADDGMEVQRRVYQITWPQGRNPWDESLSYSAPDGAKGGLVCYMTCPATWHTLNALTGASLDLPAGKFYLAPHIPKSMGALHMPLFFPTFWARVDAVPATKTLTVTILKTVAPPAAIRTVQGDVDAPAITLHTPLSIRPGAVWNLSRYWNKLVSPAKPSVKP